MIRVCYSNRIERLVGALADALPPAGDADAMFAGPWLVVPNRPLELYVDSELARRRGISGNVDTMSMQGAFARLCADALPDVVLIERGHIIGELLAVLSDPTMETNAALAPVHAYLRAAGTAADAVDRRRVDIARELGGLFGDWMLTRPEIRASWGDPRGEGTDSPTNHRLLHAERALWNALFGNHGRFARRGAAEHRRYLTLPDVFAGQLDEAWRPPKTIHVFGLSQVPRGLQIALGRLGARTDVALYAVNPCREFWEDLSTGRRSRTTPGGASASIKAARRGRKRGPDTGNVHQLELAGLAVAVPAPAPTATHDTAHDGGVDLENPLLRLWGQAGREATRLINDLTNSDFEDHFVDPIANTVGGSEARPTLLRSLQRELLNRQPPGTDTGGWETDVDDSIVVLGAPNPRRELETIAAEIWAMVRADAATPPDAAGIAEHLPMRFSDIAVVVAGPDEPYLPLARAVFREASHLPHTIVDQPLGASSALVGGVLALLALPLGPFTRREVLDVITHPNVRARFPEADPRTWLELCEALTIAHGADRGAFAGTYVETDLFNWDQGCKRLALGVFARGPRSGIEQPITLPASTDADTGGAYLPAEVAPDLRADADALALLVRSLLADARYAKNARLPLAEWMRFVRALCSAYVIPTTPDDEAARLRLFAELDQIAVHAPTDLRVTLGVAHQLLRESLTGLRGGRGQILGAGVAVGTLTALRGLPFRVIFVAGLGPERFPAADRPSPLDVDAENRGPGDVTPRQHDRYLMVETLLAARDKLVLSYLDRDAVTGDPREPSPVVLEFLALLARRRGHPPTLARSVPLHRDEDPQVRDVFPVAAAEAQARTVGETLRRDVSGVAGLDTTTIVRGLSPEAARTLGPLLRTTTPPVPTESSGPDRSPETRVLHLTDLRRFLECPLQGSARVFLGLRDLPDETEAREVADEPFDVPRYLERSLLGDVFAAAWSMPDSPDTATLSACYDAEIARQRTGRILPSGLFREHTRRQHLRILDQWAVSLRAGQPPPVGPMRRVCFGRPQPFAPAADRRDPITLVVDVPGHDPRTVEIHGTTEPQLTFDDQHGSLVLAASDNKEKNDKDSLRAFIDYVALAASAPANEAPAGFSGAVCRPSKDGTAPPALAVSFRPLERDRARAYLAELAGELLTRVHAYLLPCDAVFFARRKEMSLALRIRQVQSDSFLREHSSSRWGPVPEPFEYRIPDAGEADQMASRRFDLFFDMRLASAAPEANRKGKGKT